MVLYSDGVTEAENHKGQPFEESGLERVVAVNARADAPGLAQAILRAVETHAQETYLADDVTLLVVERKVGPTGVPPVPRYNDVTIP
jgi:serine phosphatase RsbU (regulator of sigma subunit)